MIPPRSKVCPTAEERNWLIRNELTSVVRGRITKIVSDANTPSKSLEATTQEGVLPTRWSNMSPALTAYFSEGGEDILNWVTCSFEGTPAETSRPRKIGTPLPWMASSRGCLTPWKTSQNSPST